MCGIVGYIDTKIKSKEYTIQLGMKESVIYANLLQKKTITTDS